MGQRFMWVLSASLFNSSWMPFHPGPFKGCYSVTSTEGTFSIRQEAWSRRNIKTLFPNGCRIIFLVESIEGWSKKQDKTSKQTVRSSDKSEWTIEAKWVTGKYIPRGERDVIRLRNPTEDKRAFRRMLTSADHPGERHFIFILTVVKNVFFHSRWVLAVFLTFFSSFPCGYLFCRLRAFWVSSIWFCFGSPFGQFLLSCLRVCFVECGGLSSVPSLVWFFPMSSSPPTVLILGYSFVRRLSSDLRSRFDARTAVHFNLLGDAMIQLHGVGSRTVKKLRQHDLDAVSALKPDIIILEMGTNNLVVLWGISAKRTAVCFFFACLKKEVVCNYTSMRKI